MRISKPSKSQMEKSSSSVLATVTVALVIVVFCLFAAKALFAQGSYQRRVVDAKQATVKQLEDNIEAAQSLATQYDAFESANPNAIGGKSDVPDNAAPPDGKNSRITLDALPTQYDFPALISSLSKLFSMHSITGGNIGGSDQSASFSNEPVVSPQPVVISQIPLTGSMSYDVMKALISDMERSIRPYDITRLQFSGNAGNMSMSLSTSTYYQPATIIQLQSKEVK